MPIEFQCSQCNEKLRVKEEFAGKSAKCPACGAVSTIPGGAGNPSEVLFDSAGGPPAGAAAETGNPFQASQAVDAGPASGPVGSGEIVPTRIDLGEVFSVTWEIYKSQIGPLIGVAVITILLDIASSIPREVAQRLLGGDGILVIVPLGFLEGIFQIFIGIGQAMIFLDVARGREAQFGKLFSGGPYLLYVVITGLIVGVMTFFGLVLFIIPGIVIALMFSQFHLLIIDRNMDIGESLSMSLKITSGNKLTIFAIGILSLLMVFATMFLTCCTGLIVVIPFLMMIPVVSYLMMTGQPIARP